MINLSEYNNVSNIAIEYVGLTAAKVGSSYSASFVRVINYSCMYINIKNLLHCFICVIVYLHIRTCIHIVLS